MGGKKNKTQHTAVKPTVVRYHQHHLPFENVVIKQAAADAGNIFITLHLLELARKEPCSRRASHDFVFGLYISAGISQGGGEGEGGGEEEGGRKS